MKPGTAAALATALEAVAAALREETEERPTDGRVPLKVAAFSSGIPVSTLTKLIGRREITATRKGKRGWLVRMSDVEAYQDRNTVKARRPSLHEASAH